MVVSVQSVQIVGRALNFGLEDSSLDVVLLYAILWYFPVGDLKLARLLQEAHRVLRDDALISFYPEHIELNSYTSGGSLELSNSSMTSLIMSSEFLLCNFAYLFKLGYRKLSIQCLKACFSSNE